MCIGVSIVVPIYNVKPYLEECLMSILNQTYHDYEVILVDDGSTDGSSEIIDSFCKREKSWKSIHQENSGYGKAVNVGINAARGEYISILEPDDYIDKDTFRSLYEHARENDADIVSANYRWFYELGGRRIFEEKRVFTNAELYGRALAPDNNKELIKGSFINPAGIFRRAFLCENNIWHNETPGAAFQDRGFFFLSMICARRVMVLEECFYNYRQDNPNSSIAGRNDIDKVLNEYEYIYSQITARGEQYKVFLPEHFRREFGSCFYSLARAGNEHKKETVRKISSAFNSYEQQGVLDTSAIEGHLLAQLKEIMSDPDGFYESIASLGKEIHDKLQDFEHFVIYGAGVVGKRIFDGLDASDIARFEGFAVSDTEKLLFGEYRGYAIRCIDGYLDMCEDAAVVVAVTDKWRAEICSRLNELGFRNIIVPESMGADI